MPDTPTPRTALITGASSGIGKALAEKFADAGWSLVVTSSDEDRLNRASQELRTRTGSVTPIVADLTEPDGPRRLFDACAEQGIEIEALVNDAGIGQRGEFLDVPGERSVEIIRLNIEALVRLTHLFVKPMVQRNRGYLLNVGSIAGFQPAALLAVYHASKSFVNSFTVAVAQELEETDVTVTLLCPGATDTDFFNEADMTDARIVQQGNVMDPKDVAEAAYDGLMKGDRVVIPGFLNKALVFSSRLTTKGMQAAMNQQFYEPVKDA